MIVGSRRVRGAHLRARRLRPPPPATLAFGEGGRRFFAVDDFMIGSGVVFDVALRDDYPSLADETIGGLVLLGLRGLELVEEAFAELEKILLRAFVFVVFDDGNEEEERQLDSPPAPYVVVGLLTERLPHPPEVLGVDVDVAVVQMTAQSVEDGQRRKRLMELAVVLRREDDTAIVDVEVQVLGEFLRDDLNLILDKILIGVRRDGDFGRPYPRELSSVIDVTGVWGFALGYHLLKDDPFAAALFAVDDAVARPKGLHDAPFGDRGLDHEHQNYDHRDEKEEKRQKTHIPPRILPSEGPGDHPEEADQDGSGQSEAEPQDQMGANGQSLLR